ncbi:MAG: hypothetical protein RIS75_646 [Actinomycetota bacterium]
MNPKLAILQKITVLTNKYEIRDASSSGESGQLVAFAEQAKMKIREKISFYTDSSKSSLNFTMRAEKVLDIHGRYLIEDASGVLLGSIKKDFQKSILVSSWLVLDANDRVIFRFEEDNALIAILRRLSDFIPVVGDLIKFFPYHFGVLDSSTGGVVGRYKKVSVVRDSYVLHMDDQAWASIDSRVLMGMAIALDALQSR